MNAIHNHLNIVLCSSPEDAIARGYNYAAAPEGTYKPIQVREVVVVRGGMESGRPSVDFVLEDATGQKFVFMVTGSLLRTIPV